MSLFLTFYTPTYRRPEALRACLASVAAQTAVEDIEQIVIPDHVGRGVSGMFAMMPNYVDAIHGRYVYLLADDDILAEATVVEQARAVVWRHHDPPLVMVGVEKAGRIIPGVWPPRLGEIDSGNLIVRADVWRRHVDAFSQRNRYEGDFDFAWALATTGYEPVHCPCLLFAVGDARHGRAED
jgi:hypothetical protein